MLSSRYLHLHEALGLGPMWLQQGAQVLPPMRSAMWHSGRKHMVSSASLREMSVL